MANPLIVKPLIQRAGAMSRERDKQQHFGASFCLVLFFWVALEGWLAAVTVTLLIGLAKEVWDKHFGSGFCWYDMAANLAGVCVGLAAAGIANGLNLLS